MSPPETDYYRDSEVVRVLSKCVEEHPDHFPRWLPQSIHSREPFEWPDADMVFDLLFPRAVDFPELFARRLVEAAQADGFRLLKQGEWNAAHNIVEEMFGPYRRLAAADTAQHSEGLAAELDSAAYMFSRFDRRAEALAFSEEALAMLRLTRQSGWRFGATLNNLANKLFAVGRTDEALAALGEAIPLCRAGVPAGLEEYLVLMLCTYGERLARAGRAEEGMAPVTEAIALCRRDGRNRYNLEHANRSLAIVLRRNGDPHGALTAIRESMRLHKSGSSDDREDRAFSLSILGLVLADIGEDEVAAVRAARESLAIYKKLARQRPGEFSDNVAETREDLAIVLAAFGRTDEAKRVRASG